MVPGGSNATLRRLFGMTFAGLVLPAAATDGASFIEALWILIALPSWAKARLLEIVPVGRLGRTDGTGLASGIVGLVVVLKD